MTADPSPPTADDAGGSHAPKNMVALVLGCIGVVYGDIGTSPLYAMRESLHAASRDGLERSDVLGVISLLIWRLYSLGNSARSDRQNSLLCLRCTHLISLFSAYLKRA